MRDGATFLINELSASDLGILCLTKENLAAPWLLFEAGALAKHLEVAKVIPFRFQLKAEDVYPPLSMFQSVGDDKAGTLRLLQAINGQSKTLRDEQLTTVFEEFWWPSFQAALAAIAARSRREKERMLQCAKDLLHYPRGPAIASSVIPDSFIHDVADAFTERTLILDLVRAANDLRKAVDPGDQSVTVIRYGLLAMNDTPYAAWRSVFQEARLNSPRMLAALLMVLPVDTEPASSAPQRTTALKSERDRLLGQLRLLALSATS